MGCHLARPPLPPRRAHFQPRAKSIIYLFMIGGPSQLDLFDPKPELIRRDGEVLPESLLKQAKFAQIQEKQPKIMGSPWRFARYGGCGASVSELLPHTASMVDQLAIVKTVKTDDTNHMFAELLINTGWRQFGRPSLGSWVVYGLGAEAENLPAFLVLRSGMRPPVETSQLRQRIPTIEVSGDSAPRYRRPDSQPREPTGLFSAETTGVDQRHQ